MVNRMGPTRIASCRGKTSIQEAIQIGIWQQNRLIKTSEVNQKYGLFVFAMKIAKYFYEFGNGFQGTQEAQVDKFTNNEIDISI